MEERKNNDTYLYLPNQTIFGIFNTGLGVLKRVSGVTKIVIQICRREQTFAPRLYRCVLTTACRWPWVNRKGNPCAVAIGEYL